MEFDSDVSFLDNESKSICSSSELNQDIGFNFASGNGNSLPLIHPMQVLRANCLSLSDRIGLIHLAIDAIHHWLSSRAFDPFSSSEKRGFA